VIDFDVIVGEGGAAFQTNASSGTWRLVDNNGENGDTYSITIEADALEGAPVPGAMRHRFLLYLRDESASTPLTSDVPPRAIPEPAVWQFAELQFWMTEDLAGTTVAHSTDFVLSTPEPDAAGAAVAVLATCVALTRRRRQHGIQCRSRTEVRPMFRFVLVSCLFFAVPASALELAFAEVRNAGNPADDTGHGAVAYDYAIAKHEITNIQYVEFLNAVANETDDWALYNPATAGIAFPLVPVGFERFYEVVPGYENLPVDHVSVYDAFRFANWLQNGQLSGAAGIASTEDGAYLMLFSRRAIARKAEALFFVSNTDEWYKAAYYEPAANDGAGGYFEYPTATDTPPTCALPSATANTANCESAVSALTEVGA
jgi:hypothetical protein